MEDLWAVHKVSYGISDHVYPLPCHALSHISEVPPKARHNVWGF